MATFVLTLDWTDQGIRNVKGTVERIDIDLANKPDWFLKLSPLGKTPVLQVGDTAIFESAVICEYLDETTLPRLHPAHALERARHRSWMEFGSQVLNAIGAFYSAPDEASLQARSRELRARFEQVFQFKALQGDEGNLSRRERPGTAYDHGVLRYRHRQDGGRRHRTESRRGRDRLATAACPLSGHYHPGKRE